MRTLKTSEAAAYLNVSPNTLRAWERRFGYPTPMRTEGRHRIYTHGEIAALRDALRDGLSISSAVSRAREQLTADTPVLVGSLTDCELDRAEAAMEAALALRSVERAVDEVLLPSLRDIAARHGEESAPWAVAARWACDWLARARRLAPAPGRPVTVLVGDAGAGDLGLVALERRALELFAVRAGAHVLDLPVTGTAGLTDVLRQVEPRALLIAGAQASDDEVARWVYAVRTAVGPLPIAFFRRETQARPGRTTGTVTLDDPLPAAARQLVALATGRAAEPAAPAEDTDLLELTRSVGA